MGITMIFFALSLNYLVPLKEKTSKEIFLIIGFICTCLSDILLFLFGSLISTHILFHTTIHAKDIACLIIMYLIMHMGRFLTVGLFYPILRRFGYGMVIFFIIYRYIFINN
jgi:hypothetical protein